MKKLLYNTLAFLFVIGSANRLHATDYFFNVTSGDWDVASNWSPVGVPGAGDNIFIGLHKTMIISSGVLSVNNITIQGGVLDQTGGQIISTGLLYLRYDSYAVGSVTVYAEGTANLTGTGNQFHQLEMKGSSRVFSTMPTLIFSSALIDGNNPDNTSFKAFVSGSSDVNITNDCTLKRGVIDVTGNVSVGGDLYAEGGNVGGAVNRQMTVAGVTNIIDGLDVKHITFCPNGGVIWTGGSISYSEMGIFKVPSGTTFTDATNISPQGNIGAGDNGGTFDVQGQFIKTMNSTTLINNLLLSGMMNINAGTMILSANSSIMGDINAVAGTVLVINGGPVNQTAGLITCAGIFRHSSGNTTLTNYSLNDVECNGGILTLNMATSTINTLTMNNSSTINGVTNLIINGNVTSSAGNASSGGGTISNTGDIIMHQNLIMAHGAINNTGTVTVNGNFIWYGGGLGTSSASIMTVNGTTSLISDPAIGHPNGRNLKKTLILQGGSIWTAGGLVIENDGYLKVSSGQILTASINSDITITCQSCTSVSGIEVMGTFEKYGASRLTFDPPLINSGNFNINTGEVRLMGGQILNGQVISAPGATLSINGGITTKNSGTLDCALLTFNGGELILNTGSTNTITTCVMTAGNLTINTTAHTIGNININGGTLRGSSNIVVSGNMLLMGTNGKIANTGTVTVNGNFTWNGGIIGPEVSAAGTMTVNGMTNFDLFSGNAKNYRSLILNGGGTWTQGGINLYNDGSIQVPVGATFTNTLTNNNGINCFSCTALSKFEVLGTALKTSSNKTTFFVPLVNSGSFIVNSGSINIGAASTLNGTINFAAGTELEISNGVSTQSSGTFTCPRVRTSYGELVLNSNTNTLEECLIQGGRLTINNASQTVSSLNITASSIRGLADITVTGNVILNGGGIANTGAMVINGTLTWNQGQMGETGVAAEEITVNGITNIAITTTTNGIYRTVILNGNANWTQGNMYLGLNGILRTAPTCTFTENSASDRTMTQINGASIGTFQNQGMFNITNGGNLAATSVYFSNSGTINIQTGTLSMGTSFNNTGTVQGIGTLQVNTGTTYTNTGIFSPGQSPGTLNHTGMAYTNSTLDFEIQESGGVVTKDLLNVTGNMTLGGMLNIFQLSGNVPLGTYDIATCTGTRTGTFATINYPANCNGNCSVVYTSNKAQLVLSAVLPLELLSFELVPVKEDILLRWKTASEEHIRNFEIERSTDSQNWTTISTQPARNVSTEENTYQFTDTNIADWAKNNDYIYYRLKINDLDGETSYAPIKNIHWNTRQNIQVWPNPAHAQVQLTYSGSSESEQTIRILDMAGRVCYTETQVFQKGVNTFSINIADLGPGVYCAQIGTERVVWVKR